MMGAAEGGGPRQTRSCPPPPLGRRSSHTRRPTVGQGGSRGGKEKPRGAGEELPPPPTVPSFKRAKGGKGGEGHASPLLPLPPPPACGPRTAARARALSPTQTRPDQNKRKKNTDRCYTGYPPVPDTLPSTSLPHSLCWRLLIPDPPPSIHAPLAPTPLTLPPIPHCETVGRGGWGRSLKTAPAP